MNTWRRGFIYRTSGAAKVNPVYGKTRVKSVITMLDTGAVRDGTDWDWDVWDWDRNTTKKWVQRYGKDELMYCVYIYWIVRKSVGLDLVYIIIIYRIEESNQARRKWILYTAKDVLQVILRDHETRLDTGLEV
jgi:hypothetical protein